MDKHESKHHLSPRAGPELAHGRQGQEVARDAAGEPGLLIGHEPDERVQPVVVHVHQAVADVFDKPAARLGGGRAHRGAEQARDQGLREEARAVDGVPEVLLVPLDEVEPLPAHVLAVLEQHQPEDKVGHVQVQRARVLLGPVRAGAERGVELAALAEGRDARDLQDEPAQLEVQAARVGAQVRIADIDLERIRVRRVDQGQTHVQVVGHARGQVVGRGASRVRDSSPGRPSPMAERVGLVHPAVVGLPLGDRAVLDDRVRVRAQHLAQSQVEVHVVLLGHDQVAPAAQGQPLVQILQDRARAGRVGPVDHAGLERPEVQAVLGGRGAPGGRHGPLALAFGRAVVRERVVGQGLDHLVEGGILYEPPDPLVPRVVVAHVIDRALVVAVMVDVGGLPLPGVLGVLVLAPDVRVVLELPVQEQDAHVPLLVEQVHLVPPRHERPRARQAQAALLQVGHALVRRKGFAGCSFNTRPLSAMRSSRPRHRSSILFEQA